MASSELDISVIVPVLNEAESLPELLAEIRDVATGEGLSYEVLFIDDGSTDGSFEIAQGLRDENPCLRAIQLRTNFGKSTALSTGFAEARGRILITMDGDLQDDPREIPDLLAALDGGLDLVCGWKWPRRDPLTKILPSRVINWMTSRLTGLRIHDMNCGLKAYRRETVEGLAIQGVWESPDHLDSEVHGDPGSYEHIGCIVQCNFAVVAKKNGHRLTNQPDARDGIEPHVIRRR